MNTNYKNSKYMYSIATEADSGEIINHIKRNPINMEVDYIMDRRDDFFKIHSLNKGSLAFVARRNINNEVVACVTLLKFQGQVGRQTIDFQYVTDLIKDRAKSSALTMQHLLNFALENYFNTDFVIGLINEKNLKARYFSSSRNLSVQSGIAARFNYLELIPIGYHNFGGRISFKSPKTEDEIAIALKHINKHYENHLLYHALDEHRLTSMIDKLPNFSLDNVVMMYEKGLLHGVMIYYDPGPLVSLVLDRMDRQTAFLVKWVRYINRSTGLLFSPPKIGEEIKTIQVRFLAGNKTAQSKLLLYAKNLAKSKGFHSVSLLVDEKENIKKPGLISFVYKSLMYLAYKKEFEAKANNFAKQKVFFDITYS